MWDQHKGKQPPFLLSEGEISLVLLERYKPQVHTA